MNSVVADQMKTLNGGNFYSAESNLDLTRTIYKANWASIMQATTQWLGEHHYELETLAANQKLNWI